jgi:cardiolipin synthase (CMP-forming)
VVFLGLGAGGGLPWWLVALVLGRDVAILAAAALLLRGRRGRRFPPSKLGKLSTALQMMLGGIAVLSGAFPGLGVGVVVPVLVWCTAAATLLSGLDYAKRAIDAARQQG